MKLKTLMVLLAVAACPAVAQADLSPTGDPVFGGSISQSASGGISALTWYGARVTAPGGLNGGYIVDIAGLGALHHATTESRNHPGGSPGPEIVEGVWAIDGNNSFTTTMEIGSDTTPPTAPGDYVGLRYENAAATADGTIKISREWVYTNGASPSSLGIGAPIDGGPWIPWTGGWYLSSLHHDGGAWGGGHPIPTPGATLLAMLGFVTIALVRRRVA